MAENVKKHCAASNSRANQSSSRKQARSEALMGVADDVEFDADAFVRSIIESGKDTFDRLKQFETESDL